MKLSKLKGHLIIMIMMLSYISAIGRIFDVRQAIMGGLPRLVYSVPVYLILALDCVFLLIHYLHRKRIEYRSIIVIIYLIYNTTVTYATRQVRVTEILFDGYVWPITFLTVFLYYSYENPFHTIYVMKRVVTVGTIACMLCIVRNIEIHLATYGFSGRTIGPLYYLIAFIPFFLLFSSFKVQIAISLPIAILVLVSTKRTAFLIMFIGFCGYYLIKAHMENKLTDRIKRYLLFGLAGIIAIITLIWVTNKYDIQTVNRLMNSVDDQGSGRIVLWDKVIRYIKNSSTGKIIFGHGFHSVPYEIMPLNQLLYAHNGYLEALYDLGVVGLAFLVSFVIYLITQLVFMIKTQYWAAPALCFSIIHMLLLSAFGYLFEQSVIIIPMVILWGMIIGMYHNEAFTGSINVSRNPFTSKKKVRFSIRRS